MTLHIRVNFRLSCRFPRQPQSSQRSFSINIKLCILNKKYTHKSPFIQNDTIINIPNHTLLHEIKGDLILEYKTKYYILLITIFTVLK